MSDKNTKDSELVYQDSRWVLGLCPSSGILNMKHVTETESISFFIPVIAVSSSRSIDSGELILGLVIEVNYF
jgi:hypothetical protein